MDPRQTYFIVQMTEDGLSITGPFDHAKLIEEIKGMTGPDIRVDCQARFTDDLNEVLNDTAGLMRTVAIIKGQVVMPQAHQIVTEWTV